MDKKMKPSKKSFFLKKEIFPIALALIFLLGTISPLFSESVILIHSNDTHGTYKPYKIKADDRERLVGGMEAASHYINEIRAMEKDVLVIETGDVMTGTLASDIRYKDVLGGAMVEFLNRVGYNVWSYGNHEFDKGQQNLIKLKGLAKFPTVMSNIVFKKNKKLFPAEPFHIFTVGKLKVGVIAVMEENFLSEVRKEAVEGLDVLPMVPTLNSYIPNLGKKTDLVVLIAHTSFEEAERIARSVAGIDVILVASNDGKFNKVNGVLVHSTRGYQRTLGYLKLEVEKHKVKSYEEKLIWLWADVDLKPSPPVSALVKEVDDSIGTEFAKVIGEAKADYVRSDYPRGNFQVESQLGDWVTDVMRWKTGAQIGLHNNGAIRADIKAGPVKKSDVFDVSPFQNTLVVFKLTAQQVKDALEYDVERDWDRLQVSGLKYRYYPKSIRPYGKRVDYIEVDGEVIEDKGTLLQPQKVYTAVSNDYLVGHAQDKYFGFPVVETNDTGIALNQTLMEWLEKYKILDYKLQNRIVEIK
jgi:2',3'-cyclic-nucleotide 2'-phosphodiesterase (5'-nucleotidase family)